MTDKKKKPSKEKSENYLIKITPTFLEHNLLEAKDFFTRNNIIIETLMIKDCDHHIPVEASSNALKFIKDNFDI